jgi:hypothetical protein
MAEETKENQKVKVPPFFSVELLQGEMVGLTRRLGSLPGFRLVTWKTRDFAIDTSPAYMLNGQGERRYCGCTISVFLGTAFRGIRVRYDPVFHVIFLEVDETKGNVSARNHSSAPADNEQRLTELGQQMLDSLNSRESKEKRGTKRLRFTTRGLETDLVSCAERKVAVDKLVDQWSRLDALDPDRTRHSGSVELACRFHSLYTQMEECTSNDELKRLLRDQDKLKADLDKLVMSMLRCETSFFRPVVDEVSRLSVTTVNTESSSDHLGDYFASIDLPLETLY